MKSELNARYSRQSFLGPDSEDQIAHCVVGVVGLGGGGSHIVPQLAHIGFKQYVLFDADKTEESNLNRLMGATVIDAKIQTPKLHLAQTTILGLQPDAEIDAHACRWQDAPEAIRRCHIIFGCVDKFSERAELEACARRYLIAYLDIGMDVVMGKDRIPVIGGQIILSLPDGPCMRCIGFLTDDKLATEAALYGDAGGNPQVIWPNGVLASTAVGLAVDLVTHWTRLERQYAYFEYDGNRGIVKPHPRTRMGVPSDCQHYSLEHVGDPVFKKL